MWNGSAENGNVDNPGGLYWIRVLFPGDGGKTFYEIC